MTEAPATEPARGVVPAVALLVLTAYVWRFGYQFGVSDHDELIPPVLALLDGSLFSQDWYVQLQLSGFNVRTPFTWLLAAPSAVLTVEVATALLWVSAFLAIVWGIYLLARELGAGPTTAAVASFAAVVLTPTWTLGGNAIVYPQLVPELMAWALVVPAAVLALRRRFLGAGVLIGLAAWLQVLAAGLTAASLGLTFLTLAALDSDRRLARDVVFRFGLPALLIALPFVVMVGLDAMVAPEGDRAVSAFTVIAELRAPHHYLPLEFGAGRYARFLFLAAPGLVALLWLHRRGEIRHARLLIVWLGVGLLMLVLAFAFIEGLQSLTAAKLQVFKLTVLFQTVMTIVLVMGIARALPDGLSSRLARLIDRRALWSAAGLAALITVVLIASGRGRPAELMQPLQHARSDLHAVESWALAATHRDALFVLPPSNTTFRSHARRSVVITHKPTPFDDELMHVWLDRLRAVAPMELPRRGADFLALADRAYHHAAPAHWLQIREAFGADYVLIDSRAASVEPGRRPVFAAGSWAVYSLVEGGDDP